MNNEIICTNQEFEQALKPVFELINKPEHHNKFLTVTASGATIYDCASADTVINPSSLEDARNFARKIVERMNTIGKIPLDEEVTGGIEFSDAYKLIIEDE